MARDTAAYAVAGPTPTTGVRATMITNSRAPTPDGSMKKASPASIAIAIVPMHRLSGLIVRPSLVSARNHRWTPKKTYVPIP